MKKLAFGLMRLPVIDGDATKIDLEKVKEMVDTFIGRGFSYFDTAYVYHGGYSERAFGQLVAARYPRDKFTITNKMPMFSPKNPEDYERIFNEQLERCQVEYFDWYFLHALNIRTYEEYVLKENAFDFVFKKKAEGKIKHVGFSFHDSAEVLDRILTENPNVELVQLQINYIDYESEAIQSRKCYEVARKHGKPITIMEPLKGGKLINIPDEAKKLFKDYHPDLSIASWGIRYASSLDGVVATLSGMSNMEQVLDNTSYMENFEPLNEEEYQVIERVVDIINNAIAIPCTGCRYCVDGCPMHIAIPEYFSLLNDLKQFGPNNYRKNRYQKIAETNGLASSCIECGQCEGICPQHLHIIDALKKVVKEFE